MLIHLPDKKTPAYLPSGTHPLICQFILDAFTGKYGQHPRFRFRFLDTDLVQRYQEGYLCRAYSGAIETTSTIFAYNQWPIQWELVYLVEFSNKNKGGKIIELDKQEIIERFLT